MLDSPKAAHFDAYVNGKLLSAHDPVGLEYRWAAAAHVERDVTGNMLEHDAAEKVAAYLPRLFRKTPITIRLRGTA